MLAASGQWTCWAEGSVDLVSNERYHLAPIYEPILPRLTGAQAQGTEPATHGEPRTKLCHCSPWPLHKYRGLHVDINTLFAEKAGWSRRGLATRMEDWHRALFPQHPRDTHSHAPPTTVPSSARPLPPCKPLPGVLRVASIRNY